jgi:hypothetical protein
VIEGIGPLDKEILIGSIADMFMHPTKEESIAITTIANSAVSTALVASFSGGLEKILDFMPQLAYLDSNIAISLVTNDHPRSSSYHDLIVGLSKIHCEVQLLDVFLDEMTNNCKLAYVELKEAKIINQKKAKEYAEFQSFLSINPFIAAYALGGRPNESFSNYLGRIFGSSRPKEKDFKRLLEKLGIDVVTTRDFNKSPSESLAVHIASEKGRLMKIKSQLLAQHEAVQIQWLHQNPLKKTIWFITEDATLRRILRLMEKLPFSDELPSSGVMPAYGAHLLISSLMERPNLEQGFPRLLWNPSYLEQVDAILSSVLRKFSIRLKDLKKLNILDLRDRWSKTVQNEMIRTERDVIRKRSKLFLEDRPQLVSSILRELGDDQN